MKRCLITSALPYINGMKHLGNLVGSLLPADIYARFQRLEGNDVLFICATDDHGTPAEIGALESGLDVTTYCQAQHERQRVVYERFGLSFDYFGQTSSTQNRELTQYFYQRLNENGFIEERAIDQVYSIDDQRFLPDRYVVGTCPKCGYPSARGDQCESCTALLDPQDLIDARSALSGSSNVEVRSTKHLFFRLGRLADELRTWIESHSEWPRLTTSIALKWLNEGLHDRCITRDLSWGVPVPREGFEQKVFYVWFDAPIGYIGATKEWADEKPNERDWRSWWYDAADVEYVQFLAKDNVPFHTIFFPATVLGTKEPWTLASYIKGFNWLTYYGGKFSTSQKRGVFMDSALDHFPADYWRFFLTAQAPESDDADFSWEQFAAIVNQDLANNFGNFVNRTLKLTERHFGRAVPPGGRLGTIENKLRHDVEQAVNALHDHFAALEFRKAVQALRRLWSLGNVYLDEQEPWRLVKENREAAAAVLRTAINLIRVFAIAARPIIPFTAERIFLALELTRGEIDGRIVHLASDLDSPLVPGRRFEIPPPLFQRIEDADIQELRLRFGGEG